MSWYLRSVLPEDVHRGMLEEGKVRADCGMKFLPLRVGGQVGCVALPEPEQVCSACVARSDSHVAFPVTCSTHPGAAEGVISLVVRRLDNGRIELESHARGGCVLTLEATLLFDVVGQWLG